MFLIPGGEFGEAAEAALAATQGDHIVLGLESAGLRETAESVGGRHLLDETNWTQQLRAGLADPSTTFTLSLDGLSGDSVYSQVMSAAQRGISSSGSATDWEIGQLYASGRLGEVNLYGGGKFIENPFLTIGK